MTAAEIHDYVQKALPDAAIDIVDLAGDNEHYAITISSPSFAGKSRVEQHRLVNNAFEGGLGTKLHALQITTKIA